MAEKAITRDELAKLLNEDLSREYQAIIAYVVYSQVLKGAEYMSIAEELERHASEELKHALTIARQIDYLGAMPTATALPVKLSEDAVEMLDCLAAAGTPQDRALIDELQRRPPSPLRDRAVEYFARAGEVPQLKQDRPEQRRAAAGLRVRVVEVLGGIQHFCRKTIL